MAESQFNKYRGEVRFPFADQGILKAVFRFPMKDLEALSSRYGQTYLSKFDEAVRCNDAVVVRDFAIKGLKGEGGSAAPKVDWDDPPFFLGALYQPIFDALTFAVTGLTAEEAAEKAKEEEAKRKDAVAAAFPLDHEGNPATFSSALAGPAMSMG